MKKFLCYLLICLSILTLSIGVHLAKSSQAFSDTEREQRVQILEDAIYHPDYMDLTNALIDSLKYCPTEVEQVNKTLNLLREYTFSHYNREITASQSGKKLFDEILVLLEQQITVEIADLKEVCPGWMHQSSVHGAAIEKQKKDELSFEGRLNALEEKCDRKNARVIKILRKRINASQSSNTALRRIERQLQKLEKRCQISPSEVVRSKQ